MALSVVSSLTASNTAASTTPVTFTVPGTVQPGDKINVVVIHNDVTLTVTVAGGSPTGVHTAGSGTTIRADTWTHTIDWTETSYAGTTVVFTPAASDTLLAVMYVVRGNNGYELTDSSAGAITTAATTYSVGQVTGGRLVAGTTYHVIASTNTISGPAATTTAAHPTAALHVGLYAVGYALGDTTTLTSFTAGSASTWASASNTLSPAPGITIPANDPLAGAVPLVAGAAAVTPNLASARHEASEQHPYQAGATGTLPGAMAIRSVWYTYTPSASGRFRVRVNTDQTLGRAGVGVWSGTGTFPMTSLLAYNENDWALDEPGDTSTLTPNGTLGSVVYFSGTAATTYYIQVLDTVYRGCPPSGGIPTTVELATCPAMVGDQFAGATALGADSGSQNLSTFGAGHETGEPNEGLLGVPPTASVWRSFQPTAAGPYQFGVTPYGNYQALDATELPPNLIADLWTGTAVGALTPLANYWSGSAVAQSLDSRYDTVTTALTAGSTYWVRIYVAATSAPITTFDNITLTWGPVSAPSNDAATGAATIDLTAVYGGPTATITTSYDSILAGNNPDTGDLYWKFTAGRTGTYTVATVTTAHNTAVNFYDTVTPAIIGGTLSATGGQNYYIQTRASTFGGGADSFTLTGPVPLPAVSLTATGNDAFASAYALPGDHGSVTTSLASATVQSGEPPIVATTPLTTFPVSSNDGAGAVYDPDGGYGYVVGDVHLHRYDLTADTYTALSSMTDARYGAGLCYKSGKLYVFGTNGNTAERYTITTNTWAAIASLPLTSPATTFASFPFPGPGNTIYVLATLYDSGDPTLTSALWSYDTVADTYTALATPNIPRGDFYGGAVMTSTKIIFVDPADGRPRIYTIATDTWSLGTAAPTTVSQPAAFLTSTGLAVLVGGYDYNTGLPTNVIQAYNPATDTWTGAGTTPYVQAESYAIPTTTGAVIGSGLGGGVDLNTTYRLTYPSTGLGTVWFSWGPAVGDVLLSTDVSPSAWQGTINVYTGTSVSALTPVAGASGNVTFTADGTTTYKIRLYGSGSPSNAVLSYLGPSGSGGGGTGTVPGLVMIPSTATVATAPSSVTVRVSNGTPHASVTFTLSGTSGSLLTTNFDATGVVSLISVPISPATAGTYTLTATSGTLTAASTITVSAVATTTPIGPVVTTPPTPVTISGNVRRWVFQDTATSDQWTFEINPHEMTSPFGPKKVGYSATTAIDGTKIAFEAAAPPVEWKFTGDILTKTQYDNLLVWRNKTNLVWLTDHYNRAWLVYVTSYSPEPKRAVNKPWRHTYTMTVSVFEGPVQQS